MGSATRGAFALGIALLAARVTAANPAPPPRTFAVVPFLGPEKIWRLYAPFVQHATRATGQPWQLALPVSHDALIDDICSGKVDVALVGPVPAARANKRCGAAPFLAVLGPDGSPDYHSVLLTTDPTVTSIDQLRGKEVGFLKGSTAAHVLPMELLAGGGLGHGTYRPVFLESQERLMTALLAHKVSAAGVKSTLAARFSGEPGLRVLATSPPVPSHSFVALPSLPPAVRERLASALLPLQPGKRKADADLVKGWDDELKNGFVRPTPDFLEAVLALQELTERQLRDGP